MATLLKPLLAMCELHQHAKIESWITPEDSKHLSSKMVSLFPGETMPPHTTGPDREEVIIAIYGSLIVTLDGRRRIVSSGEGLFIPANTMHSVTSLEPDAGAQYAYVVTKKPKLSFEEIAEQDRKEFYAVR